jgi:predicted  nucleic acid-binding Zn-ribbon protein
MEGMATPDSRERVVQWVHEGVKLFPHLSALLQSESGAARSAELERECERLRKELAETRKELDDLRKDHERLRADRDEVAQALVRLMDSVQPINQIAQKLGVRRSPFERDPRSPSPSAPSPRPA